MILPLLLVVFRSLWLVVVGSLPSALSLVMTLGVLGFTGARLSAAATGAAAMLFGLGVDGVVLLYVAYRSAIAEDPSADVPSAIAGPSASMLLGMWTTAATFYGLTFVDFPSLQQLGLLIGHSMVLCGLLTLVLVPALLPRRPPARRVRPLLMPRRSPRGSRAATVRCSLAALVCTVVLGLFATRIRIDPTPRSPPIHDRGRAARNTNRHGIRPSGRCLRRPGGGAAARTAAADQRSSSRGGFRASFPALRLRRRAGSCRRLRPRRARSRKSRRRDSRRRPCVRRSKRPG